MLKMQMFSRAAPRIILVRVAGGSARAMSLHRLFNRLNNILVSSILKSHGNGRYFAFKKKCKKKPARVNVAVYIE